MTRVPVRIAHRGGGSLAPENSIDGIERSLAYGIEMIEVDVRRTRDGVLVLSHDPTPHGAAVAVHDATLAELRAASPALATLDDALDAARGRARLNLDLKATDLAEDVIEAIRRRGAGDACIVSCLDGACLARVAELAPAIPRFFSYPPDYGGASRKPWLKPVVNAAVAGMRLTMPARLRRMLRPLPGTHATIYAPLITRRLVDLAHGLGIELYTWTVDDPAEMRRLAALGIDGITSNRPDLLAALGARPPAPVA
jgi:glycerophosphoryl diester phosphodiesterase